MAAGVSITGMDKVMKRLAKLQNFPDQNTKARAGNLAVAGVKSNFEGNPLGWKNLDPYTIKQKGSSQILVDSAKLKNSTFWRATGTALEIYNKTPYGKFHQEGTRRMPQRKWMVLRPEIIRLMRDTFVEALSKL